SAASTGTAWSAPRQICYGRATVTKSRRSLPDVLLQTLAVRCLVAVAGQPRVNVASLVGGETFGPGVRNEVLDGAVPGTAHPDTGFPPCVARAGLGGAELQVRRSEPVVHRLGV